MAMDRKTSLLLIPLIIAIIVIIGLIAAIVYMNSDMEKMTEQVQLKEREAERAKDIRASVELEKAKLAKFITGTADADPSVLRQQYLVRRAANEHLQIYLKDSERREYNYLTELYNRIFTDRVRCLEKSLSAERESDAAKTDLEKQLSINKDIKEKKEVEITRLRVEKRDVETAKSNLEQQFKATQARLQAQIEQERTEKQELEKKLNIEVAALRSRPHPYEFCLYFDI